MSEPEYCFRCKKTQPTKEIEHASGTEWKCAVCGSQVEFFHNEEIDDEPIGSCENCGVDLYEDDHPEYCNQCLWSIERGGGCAHGD